MSVTSVIGLMVMAMVWSVGLAGLAWSWHKSAIAYEAAGRGISDDPRALRPIDVAWFNVRQHTLGWSLFLFGLFLALDLIDMPVWARLGIVLVLGIYYGSIRIDHESTPDIGDYLYLFSERIDKAWFSLIVTLEWCGYLGVLLFAAGLVGEVVS